MIHLKFDLNQIKISKSFEFSKKNECIGILYQFIKNIEIRIDYKSKQLMIGEENSKHQIFLSRSSRLLIIRRTKLNNLKKV